MRGFLLLLGLTLSAPTLAITGSPPESPELRPAAVTTPRPALSDSRIAELQPDDAALLDDDAASDADLQVAQLMENGQNLIGTRYRLGGNSDAALDCSAFVGRIFRAIGIALPRTARAMMGVGVDVDPQQLQPGDLLFYRWGRRQLHVAVYMGDNQILHASPLEHQVVATELGPVWNQRLIEARRVL